jgi:hypothetical protein
MASKFASYTEETIWGIGDSEAEAREDGEAAMRENDVASADIASLKIAPIDDELVEALEEADELGEDILFDLIDGVLCEVEPVDEDGEEDGEEEDEEYEDEDEEGDEEADGEDKGAAA